jgi:hypothetical protein
MINITWPIPFFHPGSHNYKAPCSTTASSESKSINGPSKHDYMGSRSPSSLRRGDSSSMKLRANLDHTVAMHCVDDFKWRCPGREIFNFEQLDNCRKLCDESTSTKMEISATIRWRATVCMKLVIIGLTLRVCYQVTVKILPSFLNIYLKEEILILSKGKSQAVLARRSCSCLTGGALESLRLIRAKC